VGVAGGLDGTDARSITKAARGKKSGLLKISEAGIGKKCLKISSLQEVQMSERRVRSVKQMPPTSRRKEGGLRRKKIKKQEDHFNPRYFLTCGPTMGSSSSLFQAG